MADDTLTQKIEIEDNASAAYEKIAQAADDAAKAEKERQAASEAEEQKRILEQLDPALVKLTQSYKEQSTEMARHAKALGISVGEYARLKGSIDAVQSSEQKAAAETARLAEAERLAAEAAAKHAAELDAVDPALRQLIASQKAEQEALQKEARLLGITANELRALKAEQKRAAEAANELKNTTVQVTDEEKQYAEQLKRTQKELEDKAKLLGVSVNDLKQMDRATQDAARATRSLADETGDTASKLSQGLGIFGDAGQKAGSIVADAMDGVVGVLDAVSLSGASLPLVAGAIGTVGLALGAGALAWNSYTAEMRRSDELAAVNRQSNLSLRDALRGLEDATLSLKVATGQLTDVQGEQTTAQNTARRSVEDYGESLKDQRKTLRESIDSAEGWLEVLRDIDSYISPLSIAANGLSVGLEKMAGAAKGVGLSGISDSLQSAATETDGWGNIVAWTTDKLFGFSEDIENANAQLEILSDTEEDVAQKTKETADATAKAAEEEEKRRKKEEALAKALSERAKQEEDLKRLREQASMVIISGLRAEDQAVAAAKKALSDFSAEVTRLNDTSTETSKALEQLRKNLATAIQASEFAKNIAEVSEEFSYLFTVTRPVQSVAEQIRESFADLVPDSTITDLERLQLALLKLNTEFAEGKVSPEEYSRVLAQLQKAQGAAQTAAQDASLAKANEEAAGGLQAVSGVIEGSLSAALAPVLTALGPQGAIAGIVISLLEQGPEAIETIIAAIPGIVTGLISTIQTLIDDLPVIITDLIEGIVMAIPDLLMTVFELVYGPFAINIITELINALPIIIPALTLGLIKMMAQLPRILFSTGEAFVGLGKALVNYIPIIWEEFLMIIPTVLKQLRLLLRDIRDEVFDLLPNVLDKILTQWINKVLEKILRSERRGRERNREIRAGRNNDDRVWARMIDRAKNRNKGGA